jgi:hypothetical protein
VQWCVEQRCKILGLLAAVKQDINATIDGELRVNVDR